MKLDDSFDTFYKVSRTVDFFKSKQVAFFANKRALAESSRSAKVKALPILK